MHSCSLNTPIPYFPPLRKKVSDRAAEQMKTFAAEFGMTPSAINRVSGAAAQGDLFGYGNEAEKKQGAGRFFT